MVTFQIGQKQLFLMLSLIFSFFFLVFSIFFIYLFFIEFQTFDSCKDLINIMGFGFFFFSNVLWLRGTESSQETYYSQTMTLARLMGIKCKFHLSEPSHRHDSDKNSYSSELKWKTNLMRYVFYDTQKKWRLVSIVPP